MNDHGIKQDKITKPIQLLGAWLAGLFSIDSCFLFAAENMANGSLESILLVVAAIINVPLFLVAVFLLQTKFRPELQEDSYYSTYLSQKTNEPVRINKSEAHLNEIGKRIEDLENRIFQNETPDQIDKADLSNLLFGINKHLSDKNQIKSKLASKGLLKGTIFGSDRVPKHRNVSVSQYLPNDVVKEIVKVASELGFDSYNLFDKHGEETEEDVLFGSYGAPEYEILRKTA